MKKKKKQKKKILFSSSSRNSLETGYARIRDLQANSPETTLFTDNCKGNLCYFIPISMLVSAWFVTNCYLKPYSTRFLFPGYVNKNLFKIKIYTEVLKTDDSEFQHLTLFNHFFNVWVTSNFGGLGFGVFWRGVCLVWGFLRGCLVWGCFWLFFFKPG